MLWLDTGDRQHACMPFGVADPQFRADQDRQRVADRRAREHENEIVALHCKKRASVHVQHASKTCGVHIGR
jgi:hypothetical protein